MASRAGSTIKALNYAGDTRNSKVGDLVENLAVSEKKAVVLLPFWCVLSRGKGGCAWSKDGNGRWSFYSLTLLLVSGNNYCGGS